MANKNEVIIALHLDANDPKQQEFIALMNKAMRKKSVMAGIIAHDFLSRYNLVDEKYEPEDIKNFMSLYSTIEKLGIMEKMAQSGIVNPMSAMISNIPVSDSSDNDSRPPAITEHKESRSHKRKKPDKSPVTRDESPYSDNTSNTNFSVNENSDMEMQAALDALSAFSRH